MGALRLILLAYFVGRCLGSSMGVLPTAALDVAFAQDPSNARQLRNCHLWQGAGDSASDDDEVAALQLDDDFLASEFAERVTVVAKKPFAASADVQHLHVFPDGLFRPPRLAA